MSETKREKQMRNTQEKRDLAREIAVAYRNHAPIADPDVRIVEGGIVRSKHRGTTVISQSQVGVYWPKDPSRRVFIFGHKELAV